MSKKTKDWRKVKSIPGTIFDKSMAEDSIARQRRCGFFATNGINPAAVSAGSACVESLGSGKVRVYYEAVLVHPDAVAASDHRLHIPPGIYCEHGGYKKRHTVKVIKSVDANLSEVI